MLASKKPSQYKFNKSLYSGGHIFACCGGLTVSSCHLNLTFVGFYTSSNIEKLFISKYPGLSPE